MDLKPVFLHFLPLSSGLFSLGKRQCDVVTRVLRRVVDIGGDEYVGREISFPIFLWLRGLRSALIAQSNIYRSWVTLGLVFRSVLLRDVAGLQFPEPGTLLLILLHSVLKNN